MGQPNERASERTRFAGFSLFRLSKQFGLVELDGIIRNSIRSSLRSRERRAKIGGGGHCVWQRDPQKPLRG